MKRRTLLFFTLLAPLALSVTPVCANLFDDIGKVLDTVERFGNGTSGQTSRKKQPAKRTQKKSTPKANNTAENSQSTKKKASAAAMPKSLSSDSQVVNFPDGTRFTGDNSGGKLAVVADGKVLADYEVWPNEFVLKNYLDDPAAPKETSFTESAPMLAEMDKIRKKWAARGASEEKAPTEKVEEPAPSAALSMDIPTDLTGATIKIAFGDDDLLGITLTDGTSGKVDDIEASQAFYSVKAGRILLYCRYVVPFTGTRTTDLCIVGQKMEFEEDEKMEKNPAIITIKSREGNILKGILNGFQLSSRSDGQSLKSKPVTITLPGASSTPKPEKLPGL